MVHTKFAGQNIFLAVFYFFASFCEEKDNTDVILCKNMLLTNAGLDPAVVAKWSNIRCNSCQLLYGFLKQFCCMWNTGLETVRPLKKQNTQHKGRDGVISPQKRKFHCRTLLSTVSTQALQPDSEKPSM